MRLILAGGFLGAGKTTLLWEAAQRLAARGLATGLITNDQAPDLVDTALLARLGPHVREVAGSCFCCNFTGFQEAVESLAKSGADCVIAEPVGSCTDLSATIMQPIKDRFPEYSLAPLTVLADPMRIRAMFGKYQTRLHADATYILHLQLQEADLIAVNKVDTLTGDERDTLLTQLATEFPSARIAAISARTGQGLDQWLDHVLHDGQAGSRVVDVDYDRYANGEAVLGWLNAVVQLRWVASLEPDWDGFLRHFARTLQDSFNAGEHEIGHVKLLLDASHGRVIANLTALDAAPIVRVDGSLDRLTASLTINARVQTSPEDVENAFRDALRKASYGSAAATVKTIHCIRPGRPVPTFRYDTALP